MSFFYTYIRKGEGKSKRISEREIDGREDAHKNKETTSKRKKKKGDTPSHGTILIKGSDPTLSKNCTPLLFSSILGYWREIMIFGRGHKHNLH